MLTAFYFSLLIYEANRCWLDVRCVGFAEGVKLLVLKLNTVPF
jgi:hypothetical protein